MPDIETIKDQVRERLRELEGQIEQLSAEFEKLTRISGMLGTANGGIHTEPPRPRRRTASTRPARSAQAPSRAPRGGNRAQQAVELIGARPGLTAAELAESMAMKRNYLYRVLPALEKEGRITKQGKGYHPAA